MIAPTGGTSRLVRVVADVHIGNHRLDGGPLERGLNRRCREALSVLANVDVVFGGSKIVAGDLFDVDCPTPQVVAATQTVLSRRWAILLGNHDATSGDPGDNALAPLRPVVSVVEGSGQILSDFSKAVLSPWRPGSAIDRLRADLGLDSGAPVRNVTTIVTHCGVFDDDSPPYLCGTPGAIHVEQAAELARSVGATAFVAGDYHEHRRWVLDGIEVVTVGTLCPAGWDDPGLDRGHVVSVDLEDGVIVDVDRVPGPRFIRAEVSEGGTIVWDLGVDVVRPWVARCVLRLRAVDRGGATADELRREFARAFPDLADALRYVEVVTAPRESDPDPHGPPPGASVADVIDAWMATPAGSVVDGVDPARVRDRVVDLLARSGAR